MDDKTFLNLEKQKELGVQKALDHRINRLDKELDKIATKIRTSEVVASVSTAIGFVSAFLVASSSDFNDKFHTGVDIFAQPECQVLMGVCAAGLAAAGIGFGIAKHFNNKYDEKEEKYDDAIAKRADSFNNLEQINSELNSIENKENFFNNYMKISKDFEESNTDNANNPSTQNDKDDDNEEVVDIKTDAEQIDLILNHFKPQSLPTNNNTDDCQQ